MGPYKEKKHPEASDSRKQRPSPGLKGSWDRAVSRLTGAVARGRRT